MSRRALHSFPLNILAVLAVALLPFPAAAQPVAKAKPLALVVGINNYERTGLNSLNSSVHDATELTEELNRIGFDVKLLKNSEATKKGIESALGDLVEKRQEGQLLLVALSGHGLQSKGMDGKEDAFFCPSDTDKGQVSSLVSLSDLLVKLGRRGTNLMLVDASRNDPRRGFVGNEMSVLPPRTALLLSCSAGQDSFETNMMYGGKGEGHGLFFYHVLEGLRGKAKNVEGEVTWFGLVEYVMRHVNMRAKKWLPEEAQRKAKQMGVTVEDLKLQTPHVLDNLDESIVLVLAVKR